MNTFFKNRATPPWSSLQKELAKGFSDWLIKSCSFCYQNYSDFNNINYFNNQGIIMIFFMDNMKKNHTRTLFSTLPNTKGWHNTLFCLRPKITIITLKNLKIFVHIELKFHCFSRGKPPSVYYVFWIQCHITPKWLNRF